MFDPKECDFVPMNPKTESEQTIEQLQSENELLKGAIKNVNGKLKP